MNITIRGKMYPLIFKKPFHIAHGIRTGTESLFVEIKVDGLVGYGEAALPPYLGYDVQECLQKIATIDQSLQKIKTIDELQVTIHSIIGSTAPPVACALDIAWHDLLGKHLNKSVAEMYQINLQQRSTCTYTLGISDLKTLEEKIIENNKVKLFKHKFGGENDFERIHFYKELCSVPFCVDVNQAWTSIDEALTNIKRLKELGCLFIEQPLPIDMESEYNELNNHSTLPIVLDESVQNLADYQRLKNFCSGINIKLLKCGGIKNGYELINAAKSDDKLTLLGCMSDSTCGISGAAQLMSLVDYCDLDGPLLISNDPFTGIKYEDGDIIKNNLPGLGIAIKKSNEFLGLWTEN